MKKLILLIVYYLYIFPSCDYNNKKTCFVPISDAYPNRYFYHTPFQYNIFDSQRQWLCKGSCTIRFEYQKNSNELTSLLFDNPMIATIQNNNNTYNAGTLGLGFLQNTSSKTDFSLYRNSIFIDCTVEIAKVNSPYYLHIGIPIQRTEQKVNMNEKIISDEKVIKGGFIMEYQPNSQSSLNTWEETPSSIIKALSGMTEYLSGKGIGNRQNALYGIITDCPMTLWALADIYIQLGYDGAQYKNTNFGYYGRIIIPTTPTLKSMWNKYFFYPTIGNVDRFEFGLGINGNITFCDNDKINQTLYFDGYFGYLCPTDQMRPFDLNNGFFSRYGQVKLFDDETLLYKNKTIWAVDITTQTASIGRCFKSELVFDFVYQYFQSFFNIGYSFKSQSKEQIECTLKNNKVKIDNYKYGYCPQQYIQTPNPIINNTNDNWTTSLITPLSSMKEINENDYTAFQNTNSNIIGIPFSEENELIKKNLNYNSGLMPLQILNIFFIGYSYEKLKTEYNTIIGIKGGASFSPKNAFTLPFYEILITFELDY
jgi:hypothetical protein